MTTSEEAVRPVDVGVARRDRSRRWAWWVFVGVVLAAGVLILARFNGGRWFVLDDWDFLAQRRLGSFADLMRPHNAEHWSTLPIVVYRVLYAVVGLRHHWPYQAVVVGLHLVAVVLLRAVMRRAGVAPWTATITAASLLLFGPGADGILSSFQMTFLGSLVFGLTQLLLADHDGPWDRSDWLGLAAGAAGLMCSGLGVTMVVVVGISTWLRRGWRFAAGHVLPLAALYAIWWQGEGRPHERSPSATFAHVARETAAFAVAGVRYTFVALGHFALLGLVLAAAVVVGLALAWRPGGTSRLRGAGAPVAALLVGALMFLVVSGSGRWFFGADYASQSRYMYVTVALLLPAVGLAIQSIAQRWSYALPVLLAVLLVATAANAHEFAQQSGKAWAVDHRNLLQALSASPLARRVPADVVPSPLADPGLTIGWLLQARADGKVATPTLPARLRGQVLVALGFTQDGSAFARYALTHCQVAHAVRVRPRQGDSVLVESGLVAIRARVPGSDDWSTPLKYDTGPAGAVFQVRTSDLDLVIGHHGPVKVCT